jgi:hypothetical protein
LLQGIVRDIELLSAPVPLSQSIVSICQFPGDLVAPEPIARRRATAHGLFYDPNIFRQARLLLSSDIVINGHSTIVLV